ncbi:MAG: hypothetical protein ACI90V_005336 [Bacillariaceae sp.]|jgi:hypothetical protein
MNIIVSNKFLLFAAAVSLAISVPLTEATNKQFIRGTVEKKNEPKPRRLKSNKGGSSYYSNYYGAGRPAPIPARPNTLVNVPPGTTVAAWELKCSTASSSLDTCVGGSDSQKNTCKQCILGQASLKKPTTKGVFTCNGIPPPSGYCGSDSCKEQVLDFFNCGVGPTNALAPAATSISAGSLSNTIVAGSSGSTISGTPGYAPATSPCPFIEPNSGDIGCGTNGFEYKVCYFVGNKEFKTKVCTCRADDPSKTWNCYYSN